MFSRQCERNRSFYLSSYTYHLSCLPVFYFNKLLVSCIGAPAQAGDFAGVIAVSSSVLCFFCVILTLIVYHQNVPKKDDHLGPGGRRKRNDLQSYHEAVYSTTVGTKIPLPKRKKKHDSMPVETYIPSDVSI